MSLSKHYDIDKDGSCRLKNDPEMLQAEADLMKKTFEAEESYEKDLLLANVKIEKLKSELEQWRRLHVCVANLLESTPEKWPEHGNAPLAIAALVTLLHFKCEDKAVSSNSL